jgi:hypothetical protein
MKNLRNISLVFLASVVIMSNLNAQEFVVMNETITYSYDNPSRGFHWFYYDNSTMPSNWLSPYNYKTGNFYYRYEILSQATSEPCGIQFGIWQQPESNYTECLNEIKHMTGPGSVGYGSSSPSSALWYYKGNVDFSRPYDFWHMGIVIWNADHSWWIADAGYGGTAERWAERGKWFPMTIKIIIVAVAEGQTFSGWPYYEGGGGPLRQPTPTYGIDYINERTNKVIPSTDEYSYSSNMSGAISGSGSALTLTPGQNVYFRKKANGDTLASYVQTLTVPSNPAAPTFTWDQANQRTSTVVTSDYEYSDSPSMSGAVSGSGTYVSIAAGATKYFRKKATGSAFKSQVQTLTGVYNPSIGPEFVILNETIDYPNTTDDNGFYFFYHNSSMPVNWLSPYDYYNGQVYTRYEIISQATSTPVGLQFGIWQKLPPVTGTLYETMGDIKAMSGPGSVVTNNSSPKNWWKLDADGNGTADNIDWTQMDKVWHFGINPWKLTPTEAQIRQENASIWAERYTYWYPMKVKVIVVAVASGYTFSGWSNYLTTKPATPTYGIDYTNELTDKVVPTTDEYSVNISMSGAVSGTGQKIALTPGQNLYFRTKGTVPSDIQTLTVSARPAIPSFAVDYAAENTSTVVSSEYEYSSNADMSSALTGTGVKVNVTPGSNLYFRKKETASAFKSGIQTLTVSNRPATPQFTIDYANERTVENVSSSFAYSANADMSSATTGTGDKPAITPGTSKYFRKLATAGEFASAIQTLTAPARPATPSFAIDFVNENTATAVTSDMEYADNASMTGAMGGTGAKVSLLPGSNRYFRKKATASSFRSPVQTLTVPSRPAVPSFTIDYNAETIAENVSDDFEYSTNASMSAATAGTGSKPALVPGTNLYIRGKATASQFASAVQTLVVNNRPPTPAYTINYIAETTNEPVSAGDEYAASAAMAGATSGTGNPITLVPGSTLYFRTKATGSTFSSDKQQLVIPARPIIDAAVSDTLRNNFFLIAVDLPGDDAGFSEEDIESVNCSVNLIGLLIYRVEPVEPGVVTLKVNANATDAGNFATDLFTIYYKPSGTGIDDLDLSDNLILYPNPVKDYVEISLYKEQNMPAEIIMIDMFGRVVASEKLQTGSFRIDCSDLPGGIYMVRCSLQGKAITRKFIKE